MRRGVSKLADSDLMAKAEEASCATNPARATLGKQWLRDGKAGGCLTACHRGRNDLLKLHHLVEDKVTRSLHRTLQLVIPAARWAARRVRRTALW